MRGKIYKNRDFYVEFVVIGWDDNYSASIIQRKPNGSTSTKSPTITDNILRYDIPRSDNNIAGDWTFYARITNGIKEWDTERLIIVISESS
jgi:hypothetical protein